MDFDWIGNPCVDRLLLENSWKKKKQRHHSFVPGEAQISKFKWKGWACRSSVWGGTHRDKLQNSSEAHQVLRFLSSFPGFFRVPRRGCSGGGCHRGVVHRLFLTNLVGPWGVSKIEVLCKKDIVRQVCPPPEPHVGADVDLLWTDADISLSYVDSSRKPGTYFVLQVDKKIVCT
ncbi:hypothetical protein OIU84_013266 [Salix udensis]|uniref:Uncharacterized protein n=1 Tax=Salix udensis TaxID=889485 RepID=A0AAD6JIA1_9ROSI|nr:hypothetical protein OIU84_013266 [Salix udensis]